MKELSKHLPLCGRLLSISSTLLLLPFLIASCNKSADQGAKKENSAAKTANTKTKARAPKKLAQPSDSLLRSKAKKTLHILPEASPKTGEELNEAQIALGHMLFFDPRLSVSHNFSCASCHDLEKYGVDGEVTSTGHGGQKGDRNSPSVYNSALSFVQFWDGRASDVEEQAKGPVLNPVEMAMPDEQAVLTMLGSIPEYANHFAKAFPEENPAITFDNMAHAIGAFERVLITPAPFDAYLSGDNSAISDEAKQGLNLFIETGCPSCHEGPLLGASTYQKLGVLKAYETDDTGRHKITQLEEDLFTFKVPSLRNVTQTGPYLHNGTVETLPQMINIMVDYQLGRRPFSPEEMQAMIAFLETLTGTLPEKYVKAPALPESGPNTPKPVLN